jgi:hypothetical protein
MTSVLAIVRADQVNVPLFLHVLGAMVLVGALTLSVTSLVGAGRAGNLPLSTRLAFRSLLWVGLPAFFLMRIGAQWAANKEGIEDLDVAWLNIAYPIADFSLLLLIAAIVVTGLGARKAKREGTKSGLSTAGLVLAVLLIVLYLVAIWAMTTKPV